jgi:hypothetical protein
MILGDFVKVVEEENFGCLISLGIDLSSVHHIEIGFPLVEELKLCLV